MKKVLSLAFLLFATALMYGDWILNEGFENAALPTGWVAYDHDNDGHAWHPLPTLRTPMQALTPPFARITCPM